MSELLDAWRKIKDPSERKMAFDQLKSIVEAGEIELELNAESATITNQIQQSEGDRDNSTKHYVLCGDVCNPKTIEAVKKISDVDLIFTSPPYNAKIEYDVYEDNLPIDSYLSFLDETIAQCDSLLKPGGRFIINIRDICVSTGSRYPIIAALYKSFCEARKYTYRGMHIWYKGREESSFAWGSYMKSANPAIIDLYEYVLVFQKAGERKSGQDNIDKSDFIESVIGVWKIRPTKKIVGKNKKNTAKHPCPFPVELPKRAIKLYSHVGDVVLDPFGGIMNTAIAAAQSGRNSISIDISQNYCKEGISNLRREFRDLSYSNTEVVEV